MKVTAFIGSARKKHTYYASEKLCRKLQLNPLKKLSVKLFDFLFKRIYEKKAKSIE